MRDLAITGGRPRRTRSRHGPGGAQPRAFSGCSPEAAVLAATGAPAALLGLGDKGRIAVGTDADLVVLTPPLDLVATVEGGELVT